MKISLENPYKSIATLTVDELPDFAVLVGRNGTGKTHLLSALKKGYAMVRGIRGEAIELYDMLSFSPPNRNVVTTRESNQLATTTADAYLSPRKGQAPIDVAKGIFNKMTDDIERTSGCEERENFVHGLRKDIRTAQDFTTFPPPGDRSVPYKMALYKQVMSSFDKGNRSVRHSSDEPTYSFHGNGAALLAAAMKIADKLPHELTRDDIRNAAFYEGHTLSNVIGDVFVTYKVDQFTWALRKHFEAESSTFSKRLIEYGAAHTPPWDVLRDVLSAMRQAAGDDGLFDFDFSDPASVELNLDNYKDFKFATTMTNRTSGAQYDLASLSSGETILMTLCLASFNQRLGRRRPALLLLDEVDAVLHPTMVRALVTTLKSLYVQQGTPVLMTSHSPMTVAAIDEREIFCVARSDRHVKISITTKTQAIEELSEGLATVDTGLRIMASDGAKVTVLSEGNNARHLKKWVQEFDLADEVHVFDQLTKYTGAGQLLMYGRLLAKVDSNTHFVIVWDCDARKFAETLRSELPKGAKLTPFAFKCRTDNQITRKGIENNYDEDILRRFAIRKLDSKDKLRGYEFDDSLKTKFADHVYEHGTRLYFKHFEGLHTLVLNVLGRLPDRNGN